VSTPALVVSPRTPNTPIVDRQTGQTSYDWIKFFQNLAQAVNNALSILGEFNGVLGPSASLSGRSGTVVNILQHLDSGGVVQPAGLPAPTVGALGGVQAANPATGKFVTAIDTAGVPQLGAVNYSDVSGAPIPPVNAPVIAHEWVNGFDSSTGDFSQSQPSFTDLNGTATAVQVPALSALNGAVTAGQVPALSALNGAVTAGQVPALSALNGAITAGQLPADVPVVSFGAGAPSGASTEGYIYFNTTPSPYVGYVYHSGAWSQF
jgi:hypothetical protein